LKKFIFGLDFVTTLLDILPGKRLDQQSSFQAERYAELHRCAIGREIA
jgi:hypothetical protein